MRVIVLVVLCVLIQNVMVSEGNTIIKALSEVGDGKDQERNQRHHHDHHRRHRRRHHRRRSHRRQRRPKTGSKSAKELEREAQKELHVSFDMNPAMLSSRVSFAAVKPSLPPWVVRVDADADESAQETLEEERGTPPVTATGDASRPWEQQKPVGKVLEGDMEVVGSGGEEASPKHAPSRTKRQAFDEFMHVPVCKSISDWVERTEAHDMWGNKVEVLQEIEIGGTRVNQYFYETYCREEKASCLGIDTSRYFSVCKNKHVWAYAKIRTKVGDEGWNLIKIRGSCNCALYSKNPTAGDLDVFSYMGKR